MKFIFYAVILVLSSTAYASDVDDNSIKSFLITSDPQLTCGSNCGLSDKESRENVFKQYKMFSKAFPNVDAVFINGDLTEYGHWYEWLDFELALKNLKQPYYYGLGNHDFINNLNDCYENECTIMSFSKLYNHVNAKNNIVSFDAKYSQGYEFPNIVNKLSGSLSYSVDFGKVLMIQLNQYSTPIEIDEYSTVNSAQRYIINRYQDPKFTWLHNQLTKARKENKIIIVNQHTSDSHSGTVLNKFDVKLRFVGHYHYNLGKYGNYYYSGSTARGTYLKLDIDTNNKIAHIYQQETTNSTNLTLIDTVDLKVEPIISDVVKPQYKYIRVKNNGGYESFVSVKYKTSSGEYVTKSSNKLLLGNTYELNIPSESKNISIIAKNNTGIIWEPQRIIFNINNISSDTCINTRGTTLNSKWDYTKCN